MPGEEGQEGEAIAREEHVGGAWGCLRLGDSMGGYKGFVGDVPCPCSDFRIMSSFCFGLLYRVLRGASLYAYRVYLTMDPM